MKRLALLLAACGVAQVMAQEGAAVEVRWPPGPPLAWSGMLADEPAGATGAMLYPAPNAGGLLVAILTHSLLVSGSRESERAAPQAAADQVVTPYREVIDSLNSDHLTRGMKARLATPMAARTVPLLLQLEPHFHVASNHRAIVLNNRIRIQEGGTAGPSLFDGVIQVVSSPQAEPDPIKQWLDDDARNLREEVVAMLSHGVEIALQIGKTAATAPARTQRYTFGNEVRMERGQPLASGCGRIVLLTLRESWMSVPLPAKDPAVCTDRYQVSMP